MAKSAQKMVKSAQMRRVLAARRAARTRLANRKELEAEAKRNEMVEQHMSYAASIANRVSKSLSSSVDYDEILCNARYGLLDAAKRFDESQKVDFKTFAYYRIKGAIYDGLRKSGWLPRSLYARLKFEEASNDYLQSRSELGHEDQQSEVETVDTVNMLASIYVVSLDAEGEEIDIEDTDQESIEKRAEFHQIREHMREAVSCLPPKEKQLIMMYYFQNRTLEEAGVRLHLSKSWTSRLHARALELLFRRIRVLAAKGGLIDEGEPAVLKEI